MSEQQSCSPGSATPLPCPFCGAEDIELWTGFGTQADIVCSSCSCERNVQVADMREDGEAYPEFDKKTCRYPEWLIQRTNEHLISEWNTRAQPVCAAQGSSAPAFNEEESYALFLILDTLARSLAGHDPKVNHFRDRLLPVYRNWHAANPGTCRPLLAVPSTEGK